MIALFVVRDIDRIDTLVFENRRHLLNVASKILQDACAESSFPIVPALTTLDEMVATHLVANPCKYVAIIHNASEFEALVCKLNELQVAISASVETLDAIYSQGPEPPNKAP